MSPSFLFENSYLQPYQLQLELTGPHTTSNQRTTTNNASAPAISSQSPPRRAASPETSPEHGYANAPGPQQEENDDVVFLLSIPRRCRLHPRGPRTAGPSSPGGTSTNPIVLDDDEDTPSTTESRAADDAVVIADNEDENHIPPPAPTPTDNDNARARARPTTVAGSTVSSSIFIEDSGDETSTTSIPRGSNKRERSPSSTNNPAIRPRHQ
ncbi:hypothetical protein LCI18_007450 [Fusarium solani-melongenae]|uniref:Uncharacterized protein n=1 Tax=Fusarium solani subsp. cucurbitae TaxID=2747967 RepID=A0ACD3Z5M5_FUSSC|nr:hypothetical protein LCI18_007450 [Fusarium solani-melongenae]